MRYLTAGESHGPQLTVIIEGLPSKLLFDITAIDYQLARRQKGYGRGRRMHIESDKVQVLSGVRWGQTTGAPVSLTIENKDWTHWQKVMSTVPMDEGDFNRRQLTRPRPGHADLNGAIKYAHHDLRDVLERSSARETAARTAVGAVAQLLLAQCGIHIGGYVIQIGSVTAMDGSSLSLEQLTATAEDSPVRSLCKQAEQLMMAAIDEAKAQGDTLGGVVEVVVEGLPVGLGSHVHWDRKLDGRLAQAILSIQAFKGVEFGLGFKAAGLMGSQVHDEIFWDTDRGFFRGSNNLGGLEGGMTNGERLVIRGAMKPIPTLYRPLQSVDIHSKEPFLASLERADQCAVPAASVVAENVVAWEIAQALLEKFPADTTPELIAQVSAYRERIREFPNGS